MGRPAFKVTPALKRKVSVMAGAGWTHEEISLTLAISRPTLEKYFSYELTFGAYQRRMEAVIGLHRAAKKGNVAAAKAYVALSPKASAPPPGADQPPPPAPMGKKERQQEAAKTAAHGTEWHDLLHPPSGHLQ